MQFKWNYEPLTPERQQAARELAEKIGVPKEKLLQTIDVYSSACADGDDPFFKDTAEMIPMTEGPFFAVKGLTGSDGAFGGVPVDRYMQAYGKDGGLVQGLYVAGDMAGGRHLNLGGYKEQVINDCSWAMAGGFIAADHFCLLSGRGTYSS